VSKDVLGLTAEQRKRFDALLAQKGIAPVEAEPALSHDEAGRFEPFPMTDVQASYFFGRSSRFELGNVASHGYQEFDCAELDVARYEEAWNRVIARHDMLRALALPDATQVVLANVPRFRVEVVDLAGLDAAEREAKLTATREEMSHRVPDPTRWPMYQVRVSLLGEGGARIHFSSDALLTDIFSAGIIQEEILQFYQDPSRQLAEPELTFRDCVLHQSAREQTEAFRDSQRYWQSKLDQLAPAPDLPLLPLGALGAPRFRRRSFQIVDFEGLAKRATEHSVTPSALVLAAYVEVLRRYARRADFTLNLTIFQRPEAASRVVGDFTSTMLFGVPSAGATFGARLSELQAALLLDLDHCQASGIRVGRELAKRQGSTGRAQMPVVFTSMLGLGRMGERLAEGRQLGVLRYMITQTPQVVLDHQLYQQADGSLSIVWDVVEEAFLPGVLDAMFVTYQELLSKLCRASRAFFERSCVVELPAEQRVARDEANAAEGPLPTEPLHAGFRRQCARQPENLALVGAGGRYTYGHLGVLVSTLVSELRRRGVGSGSLVALVMERGVEQVVGALGVVEAGGAYVPIDASLPELRVRRLLEESGATHVVTQPRLVSRFAWPSPLQVCTVDAREPAGVQDGEEGELGNGGPTQVDVRDVKSADVAYVIYTSGSTGVPKGVMVTHGAAQNTIAEINEQFAVGPGDRALGLSSLSFDLSVYDIFGVLGAGACLVQVEAGAEKDPGRWAELMQAEGVTLWNSVPALMQMYLEWLEAHESRGRGALRCVLMSGDWIAPALPPRIRRFWPQAEVVSLGGATEASIWSIFHRIEAREQDELGSWSSVPYGKPLRNQRWYVLNERWEDCPEGVAGELYIGGAGLALGYHRDAERTAERFVMHPRTAERLYRTGDWGRYRAGGVIEFLGREDTQVKVGGHRIELGEIESVLRTHAGVKQALVLARGEARSAAKLLVGYVVLERAGTLDERALREYAARQLPEYMVPRVIVELDALPLSSNGKINRAALPEPILSERASGARSDTERLIVRVLDDQFGIAQVDIQSTFFELGITSIELVRLSPALERCFGRPLPVPQLFDHPSVERLAAYLDGTTSETDAIERALAHGQARKRRSPAKQHSTVLDARADAREQDVDGERAE